MLFFFLYRICQVKFVRAIVSVCIVEIDKLFLFRKSAPDVHSPHRGSWEQSQLRK